MPRATSAQGCKTSRLLGRIKVWRGNPNAPQPPSWAAKGGHASRVNHVAVAINPVLCEGVARVYNYCLCETECSAPCLTKSRRVLWCFNLPATAGACLGHRLSWGHIPVHCLNQDEHAPTCHQATTVPSEPYQTLSRHTLTTVTTWQASRLSLARGSVPICKKRRREAVSTCHASRLSVGMLLIDLPPKRQRRLPLLFWCSGLLIPSSPHLSFPPSQLFSGSLTLTTPVRTPRSLAK